jgi:CRP/FNR family transcriptional regulator, dissimilatory nitrate respiration regulator
MLEKYYKVISESLLFDNLDLKELPSMLKCLDPKLKSYKKNDYIFISGDFFTGIGIILEGTAAILNERISGDRIIITTLKQGDVFGEMIAFSGLNKWSNTIQAFENCKVLMLPKARIVGECSKICPWHRTLIENFLKLLSDKALVLNSKVKFLAIKGIREKVSTYLYEQYKNTGNGDIALNLNRNELADFLSVSRPSMSRELCKMRDEGIIDFHLKSFKILNLKALKSMNAL